MLDDRGVVDKDCLPGTDRFALDQQFRAAICGDGNGLRHDAADLIFAEPSFECRLESGAVDCHGIDDADRGAASVELGRRDGFEAKAEAARHMVKMPQSLLGRGSIGKKDRIDPANAMAPSDFGKKASDVGLSRQKQRPGFGARNWSDRKIEHSGQAVARLRFAHGNHLGLMPVGKEPCDKTCKRARAENGEVGRGLAHCVTSPKSRKACGNASVANTLVFMVFRRNGLIEVASLRVEECKRPGPMIFWFVAIAVTAIACAALLYAGRGRVVNAGAAEAADTNSHFRLVLAGIDADLASGKIGADEAVGAKGELAREMLRTKSDTAPVFRDMGQGTLLVGIVGAAVLALGAYALLGSPDMPSQPLSSRADVAAQNMDIETAIARIEGQLATDPDDLRGWTVLAPALTEVGRYADAANAYGRVIALSAPTAQLLTDRAEALLLAADGQGSDEAMDLLRQAVALDPRHAQSRLYLAAELTRTEQYDEAARYWQAAIDLSQGDEPWLQAARQGLAVAQNDGVDTTATDQAEMIRGMVESLSARLYADGGSIEQWAQLVRSYVVLGDLPNAQIAYDRAVAAYPAAFDRGDLDSLALGAGLKLNGAEQ